MKAINIDTFHHSDLIDLTRRDLPLKDLQDKTVLISGATGLIGSNLIRTFLYLNFYKKANIKIIGLIRSMDKAENIFGEDYKNENLIFKKVDLLKKIDIKEEVDFIFHAASVTQSKLFVTKPVDTLKLTIDGTRNMLDLGKEKQVEAFVYLSSMEVYGSIDRDKNLVKEDDLGYIDILNVRSSYSEGKRIAELLCISYMHQYGVNVKIGRLAQTFGAGISLDENRVFAQFANSLINKEDIVLHTKGKSFGNYCYITDVIAGLITILISGKKGEAYNISNEESNMMIKDMAKLVANDIGKGSIELVFDIPESDLKYGYAPTTKMKLSSEKLRSLGWEPKVSLKETYIRMIGSLKERKNIK